MSVSMSMCGGSRNNKLYIKQQDGERSIVSGSSPPPPPAPAATAATTRKGPWTEDEDAQLVWFVRLFGERRWDFLAKVSGLRGGGCIIHHPQARIYLSVSVYMRAWGLVMMMMMILYDMG